MAFASGSRHGLSYVAETEFGTTPSTPELKPWRHNTTTLGLEKASVESEEIRADRQIADVRHGTRSGSGDVVSELSFESFDDILEAALGGTWTALSPSGEELTAGVERRSFTVQREFADIERFQIFRGVQVNTMGLNVEPNAMVNVTFGLWAQDMELSGTVITGSTEASATTSSPVDSFTGVIEEGGSEIATVFSLELSLDNGLESRNRVGSMTSAEPSIARSNVSGTATAYLETDAMLAKFVNETESSLSVELLGTDGNGYKVTLPRIKYMTGRADVTGDGDILIPMEFRALYDATADTNILIEKVVNGS